MSCVSASLIEFVVDDGIGFPVDPAVASFYEFTVLKAYLADGL